MTDPVESVLRKARESAATTTAFFEEHAARVVTCARALGERFDAGGRLLTFGNGGSACDAAHVALEFAHPIHDRRPPLPSLALGNDAPLITAVANDEDFSIVFARQLRLLGSPADAALGISTSGKSASVLRGLKAARSVGMMTIGFAGRDGGAMVDLCDHAFVVKSFSIHRIQEVHVALLHLLWDTVHVLRGEEDVLG